MRILGLICFFRIKYPSRFLSKGILFPKFVFYTRRLSVPLEYPVIETIPEGILVGLIAKL